MARFATRSLGRPEREDVEVHNCVNNNLFEIPFFALFSVEIVSKFKDRSVIHSSSESRLGRFFRFSYEVICDHFTERFKPQAGFVGSLTRILE